MKIAATVILYYPDDSLLNNLLSYMGLVDKLYVFDNSEIPAKGLLNNLSQFKNIVYNHDGKNEGIAKRLNQGSELARKDGFEWLLTMDQDSFFKEGIIQKYLDCVESFMKNDVSMFGINFSRQEEESSNCMSAPVKSLITSGSILNLNLFSEIGGFDENLFIDEVDFEYCLRSVSKGFRIIQFNHIFLNHHLGKISYHRSIKNNKKTPRTLHTPKRIYYMTRNFLYIRAKYRLEFPEELHMKRKILLNRIKNNILYNRPTTSVIKSVLAGLFDYHQKKTGK